MAHLSSDSKAPPPASDIADRSLPRLDELVDVTVVQSFLDDFAMVSGLPVGLMDAQGTILLHAGWQDVCTRFHLADEQSRKRCFETEMPASDGMEPGTCAEFTCANGLRNIITPIHLDGHPIGAVFIGQFLYVDEEPDLDFFRAQAEKFGFDADAYLGAVARLPRSPHGAAERLMRIAGRVGTHIELTQHSAQELRSAETERVRAELALRESEDKFRYVFDHAMVGMSITGRDGQLQPNDALAHMLGYTRDELRGIRWHDVTHPDDIALNERALVAVLTGESETARFQKRYLHRDGSIVWGDVSTTLRRDDSGEPLYFLTVIVDITDRMRAELELVESNARLSRVVSDITRTIGKIIEKRDPYTQGHETGVATLARSIAEAMGLDDKTIATIETASLLHDIGKVAIPAEILSKPGALNAIEANMVRTHSQVGHDILSEIDFGQPIAEIVLQHHERMDGSGYPRGLSGDEIMLEARIIAVADVIEAMSGHRPYRAALGIGVAIEELESGAGTLYDRAVCEAFLSTRR